MPSSSSEIFILSNTVCSDKPTLSVEYPPHFEPFHKQFSRAINNDAQYVALAANALSQIWSLKDEAFIPRDYFALFNNTELKKFLVKTINNIGSSPQYFFTFDKKAKTPNNNPILQAWDMLMPKNHHFLADLSVAQRLGVLQDLRNIIVFMIRLVQVMDAEQSLFTKNETEDHSAFLKSICTKIQVYLWLVSTALHTDIKAFNNFDIGFCLHSLDSKNSTLLHTVNTVLNQYAHELSPAHTQCLEDMNTWQPPYWFVNYAKCFIMLKQDSHAQRYLSRIQAWLSQNLAQSKGEHIRTYEKINQEFNTLVVAYPQFNFSAFTENKTDSEREEKTKKSPAVAVAHVTNITITTDSLTPAITSMAINTSQNTNTAKNKKKKQKKQDNQKKAKQSRQASAEAAKTILKRPPQSSGEIAIPAQAASASDAAPSNTVPSEAPPAKIASATPAAKAPVVTPAVPSVPSSSSVSPIKSPVIVAVNATPQPAPILITNNKTSEKTPEKTSKKTSEKDLKKTAEKTAEPTKKNTRAAPSVTVLPTKTPPIARSPATRTTTTRTTSTSAHSNTSVHPNSHSGSASKAQLPRGGSQATSLKGSIGTGYSKPYIPPATAPASAPTQSRMVPGAINQTATNKPMSVPAASSHPVQANTTVNLKPQITPAPLAQGPNTLLNPAPNQSGQLLDQSLGQQPKPFLLGNPVHSTAPRPSPSPSPSPARVIPPAAVSAPAPNLVEQAQILGNLVTAAKFDQLREATAGTKEQLSREIAQVNTTLSEQSKKLEELLGANQALHRALQEERAKNVAPIPSAPPPVSTAPLYVYPIQQIVNPQMSAQMVNPQYPYASVPVADPYYSYQSQPTYQPTYQAAYAAAYDPYTYATAVYADPVQAQYSTLTQQPLAFWDNGGYYSVDPNGVYLEQSAPPIVHQAPQAASAPVFRQSPVPSSLETKTATTVAHTTNTRAATTTTTNASSTTSVTSTASKAR